MGSKYNMRSCFKKSSNNWREIRTGTKKNDSNIMIYATVGHILQRNPTLQRTKANDETETFLAVYDEYSRSPSIFGNISFGDETTTAPVYQDNLTCKLKTQNRRKY